MLGRGHWRIGTIGGAELLVHWSVPLGAVLFARLKLLPGAWIAFAIVLAAHAVGHVAMARATGARVVAVYVTGLGGECAWRGPRGRGRESAIAWGGLLGQAAVLAIALLFSMIPHPPPLVAEIVAACIAPNAALALVNLLPVPGLDGMEAWRFLRRDPPLDLDDDDAAIEDLEDPEVDEVVDRLLRDATKRDEKD